MKNKKIMFGMLLSLYSINLFALIAPSMHSDGVLGQELFNVFGSSIGKSNYNNEFGYSNGYYNDSKRRVNPLTSVDVDRKSVVDKATIGSIAKAASISAVRNTAGIAIGVTQKALADMYETGAQYLLSQALGKATSLVGQGVNLVTRPFAVTALGDYVSACGDNATNLAGRPAWTRSISGVKDLFEKTLSSVLLGKVVQKVMPTQVQEWKQKADTWIRSFGIPGEVAGDILGGVYSAGTHYVIGQSISTLANAAGLPETVGKTVSGINKAGLPVVATLVSGAAKLAAGVVNSATKPLWMQGYSGLQAFIIDAFTSTMLNKAITKIEETARAQK